MPALPEDFESLAWDFPSHGSAPKWEPPIDWWDLGDLDPRPGRRSRSPADRGRPLDGGRGHLLMAEIKAPGTFAGLLLIEPIVFPPPFRRHEGPLSCWPRSAGTTSTHARRPGTISPTSPRSRPGIRCASRVYLECGLIDSPDGTELACRPQDEAEIYQAATAHGVWDLLDKIEVPVTILAGGSSDTHPLDFFRHLGEPHPRVPNSRSFRARATSSRWRCPNSWPTESS